MKQEIKCCISYVKIQITRLGLIYMKKQEQKRKLPMQHIASDECTCSCQIVSNKHPLLWLGMPPNLITMAVCIEFAITLLTEVISTTLNIPMFIWCKKTFLANQQYHESTQMWKAIVKKLINWSKKISIFGTKGVLLSFSFIESKPKRLC